MNGGNSGAHESIFLLLQSPARRSSTGFSHRSSPPDDPPPAPAHLLIASSVPLTMLLDSTLHHHLLLPRSPPHDPHPWSSLRPPLPHLPKPPSLPPFPLRIHDIHPGDPHPNPRRPLPSPASALSKNSSASLSLDFSPAASSPVDGSFESESGDVDVPSQNGARSGRDAYSMESLAMDSITADEIKDEELWHFRHGPLPGDLAEVEAFCRIFRVAEQVHNAVMEALRKVNDSRDVYSSESSYTANGFPTSVEDRLNTQEIPLLEEKVVCSLGCIGALLYQQKQEVLSGRLSNGSAPLPGFKSIPPLAQFRANMKRCCEQLEALLLCYFPIYDDQFVSMHKKFQKLRNICFDAGYPRAEGSPSHADIPNWGAVRSQTSRNGKSDSDAAFYRGGQVTDDGVDWLIEKGFKVVVDLRTEDGEDHLSKSAMDAAVSAGKIKRVNLPVEPGNIPTKDQVVEFSKIVADVNNRPLYLHSQKGVGRTSAMVAKWREIGLLYVNHREEDPGLNVLDNDMLPLEAEDGSVDTMIKYENESIDKDDVETLSEGLESTSGRLPGNVTTWLKATTASTPFEAQRPPGKIFSKREMSNFLKGRKVVPSSFNRNRIKRYSQIVVRGDEDMSTIQIAEPAGRWCLDGPGIPRAGRVEDIDDANSMGLGNINLVKSQREDWSISSNGASAPSERMPVKGALRQVPGTDTSLIQDDGDDDGVVGDMCASTTGVVRVQSRKKAEMYLVRTDGFSCTRERVKESTLAFTHPSTQQQMLMWKTAPKTVLLLKKLGTELISEAELVASFLHYQEGMNVIVEPDVHDHLARVSGFGFVQTFHSQDISVLHERVDFVVCLGGDGVILHASNLFQDAVPPVVSFNLGSLGFLTAHPFEDFIPDLRAIIHGNMRAEGVYITLRMRLQCEIYRHGKPVPGKVFDVLNEVVVDRGSSPYLCKIECYERDRLITKVQADGVIVATPTGSTAYSTAAGGSMVHPNVPCMLFTPICPHSLSFRPVILPDSALLELKIPEDARSNAWVSFDGKRRQQLTRGDSVRICMSQHPLPTVNKSDQTDDWFRSLVRCLNWNERLEQKALL